MECPVCKTKVKVLDEYCPNCKTNFEEYEKNYKKEKKTNADFLSYIANIDLTLSIIGSIFIWLNFSTKEVGEKGNYILVSYTKTAVNWYGIIGGFGFLIAGFSLFFLLKTIKDIYYQVKK